MTPELSVIIVNYNGKKYLKECFDSLYDKLKEVRFEIIVTDNDSADDSVAYIRENFPDVIVIDTKQNLGFGKGNNVGVKIAKGKYLLLINNDTIVLDDLTPVLDFLKADKGIGSLGINMLNGDKEYLVPGGKFPEFKSMLQIKKMGQISPEFITGTFTKESYEVDWLGGAFLMMPKAVYDEVGGFDEDYFMYVEDVDLGRRIRNAGYRNVFLPRYRYIHFVGFSTRRNPMLIKGYKLYISKHFTGLKKVQLTMALTINSTVKKVKAALGTT